MLGCWEAFAGLRRVHFGASASQAYSCAAHISGGLLMSGRRSTCDSGEPDLWSNGSVFMGSREPISIDPSPHIPLQQTTAMAVVIAVDPPLLHRHSREIRSALELSAR